MSYYGEHVLPRLIDLVLGTRGMAKVRTRSLEGLSGVVVELGFGSGTNLGCYPEAVERVLAVEPSAQALRLSQRRRARHPLPPVEHVAVDASGIALPDDSTDAVLSTFTLCTIPDVASALSEARRVLRPGGTFYFLEHGLSDDPNVARWQHRLDPLQGRVAGGCHLTRDVPTLLETAGFGLERVARFTLGPRIWNTMSTGVAVAR